MSEAKNFAARLPEYPVGPSREELAEKHIRICRYLDQNQLDGLLLCTTTNIAWYTGGGEVHISGASPTGACVLLVMREKVAILSDAIEAPKLENEALQSYLNISPVPARIMIRRWYEGLWAQIEGLAKGLTLGSDDPATPGLSDSGSSGPEGIRYQLCGRDFISLRWTLTPREIERYRGIGKRTAVAIEAAARKVRPGQTEFEVSAQLHQEIVKFGLMPTLSLIAADERIASYRHPVPTAKTVKNTCMLVTCVRGGGLVCSATRIVNFGALPPELRIKHDAVVQVDASLLAGCYPGAAMAQLFGIAKEAYLRLGFRGEEEKHHQGGATGYLAREYKCEPQTANILHLHQAVAWNPSIAGTKSEDTYLVSANSSGEESLECLSHGDGSWPLLRAEKDGKVFYRPDILVL